MSVNHIPNPPVKEASICCSLNSNWSYSAKRNVKLSSTLLYKVEVYAELKTGRLACISALQVKRFWSLSYLVTVILKLQMMRSFF